MTRKILLLSFLFLAVSLWTETSAQSNSERVSTNTSKGIKFNAQPKHQSEVGIHVGHFMVIGDIIPRPSYGLGLHFRRAFDYAFAWRIDAMYGRARGLEPRNSGGELGQAIANRVLNGKDQNGLNFGTENDWYHNYKTDFFAVTFQGIWSLNSFNFQRQIRKWNWYVLGGVGGDAYWASYDAKDADGNAYDFNRIAEGLEPNTVRADRKEVGNRLRDLLDGDYETRAEVADGRRSDNGDDRREIQINGHGNVGAGIAYKFNERFNLALEHQAFIVFGNEGDLIDGYRWRTVFDLTQYRDMVNYTNIRLNINVGKREDDRSEPLWWVSPMDLIAEDLAEVKARPILDLTDTDGDGVVDLFDQEIESECPEDVDTRGFSLDSDKDGIIDCKDNEPYSPPGFEVDEYGVAAVPSCGCFTENDINKIVDAKIDALDLPTVAPVANNDWFLPMIHYDFDKSKIKNSEYGKLHNVATVMKLNPDLRIVASGYTDKVSGDCYNDKLSYDRANTAIDYLVSKYGISRDRFILKWGGEENNLIPTDARNLMNRRVEFMISKGGETNMGMPDCAGSSYNTGKRSTKYSGNKEAGY